MEINCEASGAHSLSITVDHTTTTTLRNRFACIIVVLLFCILLSALLWVILKPTVNASNNVNIQPVPTNSSKKEKQTRSNNSSNSCDDEMDYNGLIKIRDETTKKS